MQCSSWKAMALAGCCVRRLRRMGRLMQPALLLPWMAAAALVLLTMAYRLVRHAFLGVAPDTALLVLVLAASATVCTVVGTVIVFFHHQVLVGHAAGHTATAKGSDDGAGLDAKPLSTRRAPLPRFPLRPWALAGGAAVLALLVSHVLLIQPALQLHKLALDDSAAHHAAVAALAAASSRLRSDSHFTVHWGLEQLPPPTIEGTAYRRPRTALCTFPQTGDEPLLVTIDVHGPELLQPDAPPADILLLSSPTLQLRHHFDLARPVNGFPVGARMGRFRLFRMFNGARGLAVRHALPWLWQPIASLVSRRWVPPRAFPVPPAASAPHRLLSNARANVLLTFESSLNNFLEMDADFMGSINYLVTSCPIPGPGIMSISVTPKLAPRMTQPAPPVENRMTVSGPRASATSGLLVWATTNCLDNSGRLAYLQALSAFIPVHSLGVCWHNATAAAVLREMAARTSGQHAHVPPSDLFRGNHSAREEERKLMGRTYKFWFAAENFLCDSYMTEKFWYALAYGSVPVLYGTRTHRQYAPAPDAYIDAHDFASPAALAQHLLALDRDDAAYQKLHAWRQRPLTELNPAYVGLLRRERLITQPLQSPPDRPAAAKVLGVSPALASVLTERQHAPGFTWLACAVANELRNASRHNIPLPTQPPLPSCY